MDTITHGIAGALISKAVFGGRDMFPPIEVGKKRLITWALVIGAVFPDADVLRDLFSSNTLLMITWHRSLTHSLVLLPIWSVLLAVVTAAMARWRKWESPHVVALAGYYAVGILSHIFLDLLTSYGTMIWSPLEWSRPTWDVLFIIDFTFTGILLIPQLLAWAYEDPERWRWRAVVMWAIFTPTPLVISRIALAVGAPMTNAAALAATAMFTLLFLLPAARGWGLRVRYQTWNRVGLALAVAYILAAASAHHLAFERVKQFAAGENLQVVAIGALPFPPSLWHWDGLVLSPHGVYEIRLDLSDDLLKSKTNDSSEAITRTFYPDSPPNEYIEVARQLPEVQKVLWFSRFPVTQFHKEGGDAVVEFSDKRFAQIRRDRPASFTYRVRFSADGRTINQGWVRP
jgi:membrane-bound metal-dependent hydrolase YbcI (DUF457 family)